MTKIGVDVVLFIRDIKGKQKTPKNSFLRTLHAIIQNDNSNSIPNLVSSHLGLPKLAIMFCPVSSSMKFHHTISLKKNAAIFNLFGPDPIL
jgi:hypothetical protein